jgi:hypothetical protein
MRVSINIHTTTHYMHAHALHTLITRMYMRTHTHSKLYTTCKRIDVRQLYFAHSTLTYVSTYMSTRIIYYFVKCAVSCKISVDRKSISTICIDIRECGWNYNRLPPTKKLSQFAYSFLFTTAD